jgi:hypothetical protein
VSAEFVCRRRQKQAYGSAAVSVVILAVRLEYRRCDDVRDNNALRGDPAILLGF